MGQPTATRPRHVPRDRPAPAARAYALGEAGLSATTFWIGLALCALGAAAFLFARLTAWPPHEDETLALFVGRDSLLGVLETVHSERGGAPLHFLFAWVVAHAGGGLVGLRLVSALFAVASVPIIGLLASRLAGRAPGLIAAACVSASWMLLFHGVYGRMYSLFLLTSALSYLALLSAGDHGGRLPWALWALAVLATVATHPYGAIVLASQAVYVLARARDPSALAAIGAVAVLGIPFWYTDLVLAGRFDVGVGTGGAKLDGPVSVFDYLYRVVGDFTTGFRWALPTILVVAAVGAWRLWFANRPGASLTGFVFAVPTTALLVARFGESTSPESRHLIFALPFVATLVALGLLYAARGYAVIVASAVALLVAGEVAWGWEKTPPLYEGEPASRVEARQAASAWLATGARSDDVLFGFEPLYLGAWERGRGRFSRIVVPRADAKLALQALRDAKVLGRGIWVFDASDTNNFVQRSTIPLRLPRPAAEFEARVFGPFLVIRSRTPTRTPAGFLRQARAVQLVGKSLYIGDADVNLVTVDRARARLAR